MKKSFTLIGFSVDNAISSRHLFKRFICTEQYGCVRKHTESAAHKNTPHHTCKASASCLPQANASCSNAALHTAGCEKTRPSVFVSLRRDESLRWGSDIPSQRIPLFLKKAVGFGERGKTSFPVKRSFSPFPASHFTLIELLVSATC